MIPMFELGTHAAFGADAALMVLAPVVRKIGNQELGDPWSKPAAKWLKVESR